MLAMVRKALMFGRKHPILLFLAGAPIFFVFAFASAIFLSLMFAIYAHFFEPTPLAALGIGMIWLLPFGPIWLLGFMVVAEAQMRTLYLDRVFGYPDFLVLNWMLRRIETRIAIQSEKERKQ